MTSLRYSVAEQGWKSRNQNQQQTQKLLQKRSQSVGSAHTVLFFSFGVRYAHTAYGLDFDLPSPEHRLDFSPTSGSLRRGLFEHVAAQQIVRVPQPRLLVKNRGNPAGAVNRGSPSLGYFSWRSKKSD